MFKDEGHFFIKFFCIVLYLEFKDVICNRKCKIPCFNLIVNNLDECEVHGFLYWSWKETRSTIPTPKNIDLEAK